MKLLGYKTVLKTYPFDVEELDVVDPRHQLKPPPFYRLSCADWVNIVGLTSECEVILIEQFRVGNMQSVLELPGGAVESNEENALVEAAKREFEEETGYIGGDWQSVVSINPNPAIMTNQLHMFIARNCQINPDRQHFPDTYEDIQVRLVPLKELRSMVLSGKIQSCLAAMCLMIAEDMLE